jgi:hypothetical protein
LKPKQQELRVLVKKKLILLLHYSQVGIFTLTFFD